MRAVMRGVFVGEPQTIQTERLYQKSDGEQGVSKLAYTQLQFNELPDSPETRVPKWNVAVFRGQNPALENEVLREFYTKWHPQAGKSVVELEVQIMPNPKRNDKNEIIDERNGFGGLSLVGIRNIRPITEVEQPLVAAALKVESVEAD